MIILSTLINIPLYHSDKDTIGFVGLILMAIQWRPFQVLCKLQKLI